MCIVKLLLRNWILIVPVNSARSRYGMSLEVEIDVCSSIYTRVIVLVLYCKIKTVSHSNKSKYRTKDI
jgi:hypothetical protein